MPEANSRSANLAVRTLSACVFVPAIALLVKTGGGALLLLVLFIVGRGAWEFYQMARQGGHRPLGYPGLLSALALCAYLYQYGPRQLGPALVAVILFVFAATLLRGTQNYAANALLTLGGVLYLGLLGSGPLLIVDAAGPDHRQEAGHLLLMLFACIWLTDAVAYACGHMWGRKKLVPGLSPGKTVVGFVTGIGGGLLPSLFGAHLPSFTLTELLCLLLLASVGGQIGDLVESAIKRDMGVKDAPILIPGHGGVLDRFDSYLFAFPLAYLYIKVFTIF